LVLVATINGPTPRADRVATFDEAKAKFQQCWDAWKAERLNFFSMTTKLSCAEI
jgi:hypothetical protein